jgi:hypothetical protein
MVVCQAAQQIIDLRYTLPMMGIPLNGPFWMLFDNASVITSSTIPHYIHYGMSIGRIQTLRFGYYLCTIIAG